MLPRCTSLRLPLSAPDQPAPSAANRLTARAEVRTTLADACVADRRAAARTALALAAINCQPVLHVAAGVGVVESGALVADGLAQHGADGGVQGGDLGRTERVGGGQRVQAGAKEGFVGVNVAQTGDDALVEQQRLEAAAMPAQQGGQLGDGEGAAERLDAQFAGRGGEIRRVYDASELAWIAEQQPL